MTEVDDSAHGAFTIDDLWKPSIFTIEGEDPSVRPLHQFGLDSKDGFNFGDILTGPPLHATYQDLDAFQYGALEEIPQPESISAASELDSLELGDEDDTEDLWLYAGDHPFDKSATVDQSWESFYDATFSEPARYLSDLGPAAMDTVFAKTANSQNATTPKLRIFQRQPSLFALKALGIGCSSWLFESPDSQYGSAPRFRPMTISGLSPAVTESVATSFMKIGTRCKGLRLFVNRCYESKRASSTMIALAATVSKILDYTLFRVSEDSSRVRTILETSLVYQKPAQILEILQELVTSLEDQHSDVAILTKVFDFLCENELSYFWARPLLLATLGRVSDPWLNAMNSCLGLATQVSCDRKLISRIQSQAKDRAEGWENSSTGSVVPLFVTNHVADVMLETCNSITLLKEHSKDTAHLLHTNGDYLLKWDFSTAHSQTSAKPAIQTSVDPYDQPGAVPLAFFETTAMEMESLPTADSSDVPDELVRALELSLSSNTDQIISGFSCPLPLSPNISFANTVEMQHRSIGRLCLRMLFRDHGLRTHLSLQRRFHFFGDGLFAARLSQALFSSEVTAINNRRDYSQAGDHGLRLGDRSIWPPGGSELRLVLMGILNESYYGSFSSIGGRAQELPGNFSFGIRQLSDPEIEAIMDPHSLAALDFLRLQYTASSPLNTVLTETALEKYDAIFKLLLRVLRLLSVTSQMAPHRNTVENATSARFRVVATRFMEALSSYFLQDAIAQPWSCFEARIIALDTSLDEDNSELGGKISSVLELRTAHDAMLDAVLFGLLLRHRQAPVMQLLEDIFTLILRFAQLRKLSSKETEIKELYGAFRTKAGTFVTVCRGLCGKKSYITGAAKDVMGHGGDGGIEQLVLRLDMNGWWTTQG